MKKEPDKDLIPMSSPFPSQSDRPIGPQDLSDVIVGEVMGELVPFCEATVIDFSKAENPGNFKDYLIKEIKGAMHEMALSYTNQEMGSGHLYEYSMICDVQKSVINGFEQGFAIKDDTECKTIANKKEGSTVLERIQNKLAPLVYQVLRDTCREQEAGIIKDPMEGMYRAFLNDLGLVNLDLVDIEKALKTEKDSLR